MAAKNNPETVVQKSRSSALGEQYSFPLDIDNVTQNKMILHIKEYVRGLPTAPVNAKDVATIELPLPVSGFVDSTDLNFDDTAELGSAIGGLSSAQQNSIESIVKGAGAALAMTAAKGVVEQSGELASRYLNKLGLGILSDAAKKTAQNGSNAAEIAAGLALNQNLAVLFKGVQLRKHDFTWRFAPTSAEESRALENIILRLKKSSLPESLANFSFLYPHIVFLQFTPINFIKVSKLGCFMTNVKVDYAPSGQPAFFKGTSAPVFIDLSISLVERSIMTQEDYDAGLYSQNNGGN